MKKRKSPKQHQVSVNKAVMRTLILACAYLCEEEGWNEHKIQEFHGGIARWTGAINDHVISMEKVCNIINEKLDMTVRWD